MFDSETVHFLPSGGGWWDLGCVCVCVRGGDRRKYGGGGVNKNSFTYISDSICEKTSFSPRSSPLGTFRAKERLRLSDRNSILMTQINVYLINPVVMGFQM